MTKKVRRPARRPILQDGLLLYEDWIAAANVHANQDWVWRHHELLTRTMNDGKPLYQNRVQVEETCPWHLSELGGESGF